MLFLSQLLPQRFKNYFHYLSNALAVIVHGYPARRLVVIGVTGTDGKTTTATLIYHLLKHAGYRVGLVSTVAAYLDSQKIDTGFHVTNPHAWALQKLMKTMVNQGYTHLVLEVTSHGLDQHRDLGTNISYAVFTNVTHEHLDYHRTFSQYLKTKATLMRRAKVILLNKDDASYNLLKQYAPPKSHLLAYTRSRFGPFKAAIMSRFKEEYNQSNALAAVQLATHFKLKGALITQALTTFPGVEGRMQAIKNHRQLNIIVDFAHTPNALQSVLDALRQSTRKKLIAVYGAAGLRDAQKRPLMGAIGARLCDEVVLTAEDPRSENVYTIIRQMKEGVTTNVGHMHAIIDRQQAINFAINTLARAGDTVAVLGKGHEQSMNLNGRQEIPWSDVDAVTQAIKGHLHA